MSKIESYISNLDITNKVTDEEVSKAESLLRLYAPTLRRAGWHLDEMRDACYESRRQSISDFINLAIDYDHDTDRKRIAERLSEIGHNMQLLGIMERALVLVRAEPKYGTMYYDILHARFFDAYCTSNEDAFLRLGISSATFYRHLKKAIRVFAANLWCIVIPDLVISESITSQDLPQTAKRHELMSESQLRDHVIRN